MISKIITKKKHLRNCDDEKHVQGVGTHTEAYGFHYLTPRISFLLLTYLHDSFIHCNNNRLYYV